jgi:hypothetical protein
MGLEYIIIVHYELPYIVDVKIYNCAYGFSSASSVLVTCSIFANFLGSERAVGEVCGVIMVEFRYLYLTLFVFFAVFTIKDLFVQSEPDTKEIPLTKVGANKLIGPTLKFLYW